MGLATVIDKKNYIETDILYPGAISHQQNIALVRLLGIDLLRYSPNLDLSRYASAIYMDNQGAAFKLTEPLEAAKAPTLVVVDHYELQ